MNVLLCGQNINTKNAFPITIAIDLYLTKYIAYRAVWVNANVLVKWSLCELHFRFFINTLGGAI